MNYLSFKFDWFKNYQIVETLLEISFYIISICQNKNLLVY